MGAIWGSKSAKIDLFAFKLGPHSLTGPNRYTIMTATQKAFDKLRSHLKEPRVPRPGLIKDSDQLKLMTAADGLAQWVDGTATAGSAALGAAPLLTQEDCANLRLWVVRKQDVVHASESCKFGKTLQSQEIKHTNLTGGEPAYSGGEIIVADAGIVYLNGRSGRYGPGTREELHAVADAFVESGYGVWLMGWDEEANRPAPFIGTTPQWVS